MSRKTSCFNGVVVLVLVVIIVYIRSGRPRCTAIFVMHDTPQGTCGTREGKKPKKFTKQSRLQTEDSGNFGLNVKHVIEKVEIHSIVICPFQL